jgi:hypothetical protein
MFKGAQVLALGPFTKPLRRFSSGFLNGTLSWPWAILKGLFKIFRGAFTVAQVLATSLFARPFESYLKGFLKGPRSWP